MHAYTMPQVAGGQRAQQTQFMFETPRQPVWAAKTGAAVMLQ